RPVALPRRPRLHLEPDPDGDPARSALAARARRRLAEAVDAVLTDELARRWKAVPFLEAIALGGIETWERTARNLFPELSTQTEAPGLRRWIDPHAPGLSRAGCARTAPGPAARRATANGRRRLTCRKRGSSGRRLKSRLASESGSRERRAGCSSPAGPASSAAISAASFWTPAATSAYTTCAASSRREPSSSA